MNFSFNPKDMASSEDPVDFDVPPMPAHRSTGRLPPSDAAIPVDCTDGIAPAEITQIWSKLLVEHLIVSHRMPVNGGRNLFRIEISHPEKFRGQIKSGRLGSTRFCHLKAGSHLFVNESDLTPFGADHIVVLQLSGCTEFRNGHQTVKLLPGDMLLVNRFIGIQVEHRGSAEQVVLFEPLDVQAHSQYAGRGLVASFGPNPILSLLSRWVFDACLSEEAWQSTDAASDVANFLALLIRHALRQPGQPRGASMVPSVTREGLEDYVRRHVEDPGLSMPALAQAFDCSVRTLHRVFRRPDGESLERFIWRTRLDGCAQALRCPFCADLSLTELALRYGFTSPAHFSGRFRKTYGISPTEYRRMYQVT